MGMLEGQLLEAVRDGNMKLVQRLIELNADVNADVFSGEEDFIPEDTMLVEALRRDYYEIAEILLDAGAEVFANGVWSSENALSYAIASGNVRILKKMLDKGNLAENIPEESLIHESLILDAIDAGNPEILKMLIDAGASVKVSHRSIYFQAYSPVVYSIMKGVPADMVKTIISAGSDPNTRDNFLGTVPVIIAAGAGRTGIVKLLLESGADKDDADDEGKNVLMHAIEGGAEECALFLINAGADVNALCNDRETPLFYAARKGMTAAAARLIKRGVDLNIRNRSMGQSALFAAVKYRRTDIAGLFLDCGMDPGIKDNEGKTVFETAEDADIKKILAGHEQLYGRAAAPQKDKP
jgi:ankyrin repeat protein